MRQPQTPLLPIFRSRSMALLLAHLFNRGTDEGESIGELAKHLDVARSTVQRDVAELERAGIVESRSIGTSRLVRPSRSSPYFEELASLLLKAFGPREVLTDLLQDISGIREAFLFGSWARRYLGEKGPPPADVDLLIIGDRDVDVQQIYRAASQASRLLGRDVQPTILSADEWERKGSSFLRTIREGPLIPLTTEPHAPPADRRRKHEVRWVLPNHEGGWRVVRDDHQRASAYARTKAEAIDRARQIVRNLGGGEVLIANRDGRIAETQTVGPAR